MDHALNRAHRICRPTNISGGIGSKTILRTPPYLGVEDSGEGVLDADAEAAGIEAEVEGTGLEEVAA